MMSHATNHSLIGRGIFAALIAVALAGCYSPPAGAPETMESHPIKPVLTNYVMQTQFKAGTGTLVHEHDARLERFVQQYQRRGRSHLMIATTRDAAGEDAHRHMANFKRRLIRAGIDPQWIHVQPGAAPLGGGHSVVMSFRGFDLEAPECGDWSGGTGFNPGNLPHTNYGCAYQRNFGLMLSDPGELVKARDPESIDPNRLGGITGAYRTGDAPEALLPTID